MLLHLHEWGERHAPPLVCLHGVTGHGRRFRRLAEEHLASRFRVLAPDLRGHGRSGWDPPWTIHAHLADVRETLEGAGVSAATWLGHSFGGRLVLELAAMDARLVERAVLLDPAIDLLPHVGFDMAEDQRRDRVFDSVDEAIDARLEGSAATSRPFVEEEVREHLAEGPDGRFRWRYCQSAVVAAYGELCMPPPPPERLSAPTLLVYAADFGLVRPDQLDLYTTAVGGRLELVAAPGGHMVIWDAYEQTADAVVAFLEDSRA
jgi:lipase